MDALLGELRYTLRRLIKTPGFTFTVVLTLALGIGANTAIFSVINTVLLRPLPYRQPDRLVTVEHLYPSLNGLEAPVSVPGFRDYREKARVFENMAVQSGWAANLTGIGEPERLTGSQVTGHFFATLGVPAYLGRTLLPDEDQAGRNHVVVLSHGLWQRLFGGERSAVSKTISLNGEPFEIVGVMPPTFRNFFGTSVELWAPIVFRPEQFVDNARTNEWLSLTARLKEGVSLEQARAEMANLATQLKQQYPDNYPPDWNLIVTTLNETATGNIKPALLTLLGAVGFVLLIACANVANLLLARAAARQKEIAVRTALGATRWQLIRQLLTESVILSLLGGALGLLLAFWSVESLVALNSSLPRASEIGIDGAVGMFTLGVSVLTGLLFGLIPAIQMSGADLHGTLKEGGRSATTDRRGHTARRVLVAAEVALALTLLTGAGLLIKSFARLQKVDPGFDPDNLLTLNLALPQSKYPSDTLQIAFFDQVLPRLAAVPGVRAAGATSVMPFGGNWSTGSFQIEGIQVPDGQPGPWGDIRIVSPDFLKTLGAPLLKGRFFTEADGPGAPRVAVIDEEFVQRYWPKEEPLGKRITFGPPAGAPDSAPNEYIEIVGVVGHTAHEGLDADARIQLYLPYRQVGVEFMAVAVRTQGDPLGSLGAVKEAIRSIDRDLAVSQVRTMDELLEQSVGQRKFAMLLIGLFSALAVLLASIGIYGVMSYSVTQRSRELGVRMALGAAKSDVLRLVLRQGMTLVVIGAAIGLAAALSLTRLITSQLFAVRATDPMTFVGVTLLLGTIALVANLLPALRATRVDPVQALREE